MQLNAFLKILVLIVDKIVLSCNLCFESFTCHQVLDEHTVCTCNNLLRAAVTFEFIPYNF